MLTRELALLAAVATLTACASTTTSAPDPSPAPSAGVETGPTKDRKPRSDKQDDKRPETKKTHKPRKRETTKPRTAQQGEVTLRLRNAVDLLHVAAETRDGYDRDLFEHWVDADDNCRDTRDEVLAAEALVAVSGCDVEEGSWRSMYDAEMFTDSSELDVDHMVPLAEAWDSGAISWRPDTRERFANDLGDPRALLAVSASSNRSKSDQDPAEWLPERRTCRYVTYWVVVKTRWSLTVDPTEQAALAGLADGCPDRTITVALAEVGRGPAPDPPQESEAPPERSCEAGYSPCVPVFPPDLDCGDLDGPYRVTGDDPHGLDGDGDGVACSS